MDKREKWELAGVAALILLILYFVLRRGSGVANNPAQSQSQATTYGPWYMAYNVPKGSLPTVDSAAQSSNNVNPNLPSCGCDQSGEFFASTNQFTKYLTSKLSDIADTYTQNVLSVLPPFLKETLNNPNVVQEATQANAQFG